jgi:hypothetical protein
MKKLINVLILLMLAQCAEAQVREHRLEEDEVFQMEWHEGSELFINAEQADITIQVHEEDFVKCVFTRSSQHRDKTIAQKELSLMKLYQEAKKNSLSLRNYVNTNANGQKPESRLKGKFIIYVPKLSSVGLVKVWNYFGTVEIKDILCPVELKLEFSNLKMKDVASNGEIQMKYGEALFMACEGDFVFRTNRTNAEIDHHRGSLELIAEFSEIELMHLAEIKLLDVKSKRSKLFLDIPMASGPTYAITTTNTESKSLVGPELEGEIESGKVKFTYEPISPQGIAEIEMETGKLNYIIK